MGGGFVMFPSIQRTQKMRPEEARSPHNDILGDDPVGVGDASPMIGMDASDGGGMGGRSYYGEPSPSQSSGGMSQQPQSYATKAQPLPSSFSLPAPAAPAPAQAPVVNAWGAANDQWRQSQGMAPQNPTPAPATPSQPPQPSQQAAPAAASAPAQPQQAQAQSFGGGSAPPPRGMQPRPQQQRQMPQRNYYGQHGRF